MLALTLGFVLVLVSLFAFVSARRQAGEADVLTEGCARAHGALWIVARDLVRREPTTAIDRAIAIAASRGRHNAHYRAVAMVLGAERYRAVRS